MDNICINTPKRRLDSNCIEESNGLFLNNAYIPEEVVALILSFVKEDQLFKCSLVCKQWNDIIKSRSFWIFKTQRKRKSSPKNLPWYAYYCLFTKKFFDENLLLNGCGQEEFRHWQILANRGNQWKIENPPVGSDPVPESEEFGGNTSCFATTFQLCSKTQTISFEGSPVFGTILDELQPDICVSEWYAGRFDCGCVYTLRVTLLSAEKTVIDRIKLTGAVSQWEGRTWHKVEHVFRNYGKGVRNLVFQHEGKDAQFWAGHYGSKMSGGCVRISFDSLDSSIPSDVNLLYVSP